MINALRKIASGIFGTRPSVFSKNAECYKILGIKPGATLEMVQTAYKEQSERLSADRENFSHDGRLKQRMEELIRELDYAFKQVTREFSERQISCGRDEMNQNAIMVIQPYWHAGTWVFDDASKGLDKEPFVCGIPEIIDLAVENIENAQRGFRLLFSGQAFPGHTFKLVWKRSEDGGNWYVDGEGREGWLCPALFKYFREAPKELYAKAEAVQK